MTAGNKNASSSASVPPAVQQFTLEELIRVLQNHRIEVISPHQQMNEEVEEQRVIEQVLEEQRDIERSLSMSHSCPSASSPIHSPSPCLPLTNETSTGALTPDAPSTVPANLPTASTEGSWTLMHTNSIPHSILVGGDGRITSPIPTTLIDTIISGLMQARVNNGDGPGFTATDPKGKAKEEDDPDYNLVTPARPDITGFVCAKCKAHNLVRPASDSWYVVTVGRDVGVFSGWPTVQPLVIGVSGSCYKRYKSEADARAAYELAVAAGTVHVV